MKYSEHDKQVPKVVLGTLDELYPYNDKLQVVRVLLGQKYYDIHLGAVTFEVPSPKYHLVMVVITNAVLSSEGFTSNSEQYSRAPGTSDDQGRPSTVSMASAFLIDKNQKVSASNPKTASAAFSIQDTNMADPDRIRVSITPSNSRDYTNYELEPGDRRNSNIGIFSNDSTVMIKSPGGAITIGKEGIHFSGNVYWDHHKHGHDIMVDNPLNGFIPETIVTPFTVGYIPNFATFMALADAGHTVVSVSDKISKSNNLIKKISGGIT